VKEAKWRISSGMMGIYSKHCEPNSSALQLGWSHSAVVLELELELIQSRCGVKWARVRCAIRRMLFTSRGGTLARSNSSSI
jgi:hypothetical protein